MALQRTPDGKSVGFFGVHKDKFIGNRGDHVVFIPWPIPEAQEWIDKSNQWNTVKPGAFDLVVYDPNVNNDPALLNIAADRRSVIYIRGHGNPGAPYIQVKVAVVGRVDPDERKLPIVDACQRLIDMGLPSTYPGAIKFYSCHSGTKLIKASFKQEVKRADGKNATFQDALNQNIITQGQFDTFTGDNIAPLEKSMASQGANYFRRQGFNRCAFYGYLGPLGSTYEKDANDDWHKVVALEGLHDAPKDLVKSMGTKVFQPDTTVRPSIARIRV